MPVALRAMIISATVCLCGCPFGTPHDHKRPFGHHGTTIDVAPADDALLFNAAGNGGGDLYLLDLTSFKVTRIAATEEYETAPSFSADGQQIVYTAGIPGDRADHIFTIGRDGNSKTQLTRGDVNDTSPRFSPDGKRVVFARDKTYNWGGLAANWVPGGVICVIDANGKNLRQLTPDNDFAFEPFFTLDGKHVIYSAFGQRMSVPVDGSSGPKAIPGPVGAVPSFDGRAIAYSRGKYSPDLKIFMANADGTAERLLTPDVGGCYRPAFTHSGDAVYFLAEAWPDGPTGEPKFSAWKALTDGSGVREVTDLRLFDDPLNWTR
jgi:Tol biopolymer transport system component